MAIKKGLLFFWTGITVGTVGAVAAPIAMYFSSKVDVVLSEISKELNQAIEKISSNIYTTKHEKASELTIYNAINTEDNNVVMPGETIPGDVVTKLGLNTIDDFIFASETFPNIKTSWKLLSYNHNTKMTIVNDAGNSVEKLVSSAKLEIQITITREGEPIHRRKVIEVTGFQNDPLESVMRDVTVFPSFKPNKDKADLDAEVTAMLDADGQLVESSGPIYRPFVKTGAHDFITNISALNIKYPSDYNYNVSDPKSKVEVDYAFWKIADKHKSPYTYQTVIRFKYGKRIETTRFQVNANIENPSNIYLATQTTEMQGISQKIKEKLLHDSQGNLISYITSKSTYSQIRGKIRSEEYIFNHYALDELFGLPVSLSNGKLNDLDNNHLDIIDEYFSNTADYDRSKLTFKIIFSISAFVEAVQGGYFKVRVTLTNAGKTDPIPHDITIRSSDYSDKETPVSRLAKTKNDFALKMKTNMSEGIIESLPRIGTNVSVSSFTSENLSPTEFAYVKTGNSETDKNESRDVEIVYDVVSLNLYTYQAKILARFYGGADKLYDTYSFTITYPEAILIAQKQMLINKYSIVGSGDSYTYTDKNIGILPDSGSNVPDKVYPLNAIVSDAFSPTNGVSVSAKIEKTSTDENYIRKVTITLHKFTNGNESIAKVNMNVYYPKAELNARLDKFKDSHSLKNHNDKLVEEAKKLVDLKNSPNYSITSGRAEVPKAELFTANASDQENTNVTEKFVITKFDDVEEGTANVTATFSIKDSIPAISVSYSFIIQYKYDKIQIVNKVIDSFKNDIETKIGLDTNPNRVFVGETDPRIQSTYLTYSDSSFNSLSALRALFGGDGSSNGAGIPSLIQTTTIPKNVKLRWSVTNHEHGDDKIIGVKPNDGFGREYNISIKITYNGFTENEINEKTVDFKVQSSNYYETQLAKVKGEIDKAILVRNIVDAPVSSFNGADLTSRIVAAASKTQDNLHSVLGSSGLYIAKVLDGTSNVQVSWSTEKIEGSVGVMYKITIRVVDGHNPSEEISFYIKSSDYVIAATPATTA